LSRSLYFATRPLLPGTSLRALGRRRIHPPSARGLHSYPLGGYAGGKWWRRAWIFNLSQQQKQQWMGTWLDLFQRLLRRGVKTLRVSASIYNLEGALQWPMDKYRRLTQRRLPDSSSSGTRYSPSQGLGYIRPVQWVTQDSRSTQDTFYSQDDPSIREEVLDSRLGGSMPRVLRVFLWILRDNLSKTSD
jgi:hypothetical protein